MNFNISKRKSKALKKNKTKQTLIWIPWQWNFSNKDNFGNCLYLSLTENRHFWAWRNKWKKLESKVNNFIPFIIKIKYETSCNVVPENFAFIVECSFRHTSVKPAIFPKFLAHLPGYNWGARGWRRSRGSRRAGGWRLARSRRCPPRSRTRRARGPASSPRGIRLGRPHRAGTPADRTRPLRPGSCSSLSTPQHHINYEIFVSIKTSRFEKLFIYYNYVLSLFTLPRMYVYVWSKWFLL